MLCQVLGAASGHCAIFNHLSSCTCVYLVLWRKRVVWLLFLESWLFVTDIIIMDVIVVFPQSGISGLWSRAGAFDLAGFKYIPCFNILLHVNWVFFINIVCSQLVTEELGWHDFRAESLKSSIFQAKRI